ncbi:hypothetical protein [Persicobacter diffluens]|uniref:DUF4595 domain-containing protein n=1 Tax=Persicobacter diffluens TaxID=981 RepID=A0AAN4VVI0_9BACT|nr:hypothetical protein PEDI_06160 [Persicobacter diffluens]
MKLFSRTLALFLLTVGFFACSSDDDGVDPSIVATPSEISVDDNGVPFTFYRFEYNDDQSVSNLYIVPMGLRANFTYDSEGKLTSYIFQNEDGSQSFWEYRISWNDGQVAQIDYYLDLDPVPTRESQSKGVDFDVKMRPPVFGLENARTGEWTVVQTFVPFNEDGRMTEASINQGEFNLGTMGFSYDAAGQIVAMEEEYKYNDGGDEVYFKTTYQFAYDAQPSPFKSFNGFPALIKYKLTDLLFTGLLQSGAFDLLHFSSVNNPVSIQYNVTNGEESDGFTQPLSYTIGENGFPVQLIIDGDTPENNFVKNVSYP